MRQPRLGSRALLRQAGAPTAVAVDALVHQGVGRVQDPLDGRDSVLLLAGGDIALGEAEVVQDAGGVGLFLEQIVVLEEVVMAESRVRDDQRLHGHGVLFHEVGDAGVGVDHDLVGEARIALAVERLVAGEALPERPVVIEDRHADRGVGVEHLLGADQLDLVGIGVQAHLADGDLFDRVVGAPDRREVPLAGPEEQPVLYERAHGCLPFALTPRCASWRTAGGTPGTRRPWRTPAAWRRLWPSAPPHCSRATAR